VPDIEVAGHHRRKNRLEIPFKYKMSKGLSIEVLEEGLYRVGNDDSHEASLGPEEIMFLSE
jgi:hypothetical protein